MNSLSDSNAQYNINDSFSQKLIAHSKEYSNLLYKKGISSSLSNKKAHERELEAMRKKLHKYYENYPNSERYKTFVTLGVTDNINIEQLIISLQKDAENDVRNPFLVSNGGNKRHSARKKGSSPRSSTRKNHKSKFQGVGPEET